MRVAVVLLALSLPAIAAAQPALTPPIGPCPDEVEVDMKSESTATLLALGTTAAGFAAMYAAADSKIDGLGQAGALLALIGPSAGHIYAGENGHAVKMSLLRGAGVTVMMVGLLSMFSAGKPCGDCVPTNHDDNTTTGEKMMIAGGLTFAIATAYDLFDAHRAARRANERAQPKMWTLVPSALAASGTIAPALTLSGRF